jgi:DNA-binding LacI/PurR family transcriptional regulator
LQTPRVTLKEIAKVSGVDISTVSRSLTGAYGIRSDTRKKVLAVAAEMNYRPNRVARGLATGRSHAIGLIVSDIRNPFFAEVARGAEDAAYTASCDLVLCNSDLDARKQMRYIQTLLDKHVDGLLMNSVGGLDREQQEQLAASGIPVVLLNRPRSASNFSTVTADNAEGGFLAGQRLSELGHRRIAHLTGPRDHGNMRERARGFLRAIAPAGATPVVIHGDHTFHGGYAMMHAALAKDARITAVFAGNDVIAFGAVRAILEAGRNIPDDISIIGFDNVELAIVMHPPLTTIHQPKYEIGHAAVDMLLNAGARAAVRLPEHRILGVTLIERQSCAPPPRSR